MKTELVDGVLYDVVRVDLSDYLCRNCAMNQRGTQSPPLYCGHPKYAENNLCCPCYSKHGRWCLYKLAYEEQDI